MCDGDRGRGRGLDKDLVHVDNGSGVLRDLDGSLAQDILLHGADDSLPHLTLDAVVDGVQDGVDGGAGLVGRLGTLLVDARLDEDAVPLVVGLLVDGVGAANITLRSVADKVDGRGGSSETMLGLAPLAHQA